MGVSLISINNYVVYHLHSDYSLLDSCTKFEDYVNKAVELGQTAIASTEHGNIYNWTDKKMYCDKKGVKYIHGCEVYLTEKLYFERKEENENVKYKIRDNYHTILLAKNFDGVKELNQLISKANERDHFYFDPRITFEEFLSISDNIIRISACLASPLNIYKSNKTREKIEDEEYLNKRSDIFSDVLLKYNYLEIQPHVNIEEQKEYNKYLYNMSKKYNIPLIAGTDTHSINKYKEECRSILLRAKKIEYSSEEELDLSYKSYDELADMFKEQNSLPKDVYLDAINNTNIMAKSIEDFKLDTSIKYPVMYDDDEKELEKRTYKMFHDKLDNGIIPLEQKEEFEKRIKEELSVFKKVNMSGFMLSMSEFICYAKESDIPIGTGRGSASGSSVAYITNITDVNPVLWGTVFSRFCNEDRLEIGDIDVDVYKEDRQKIYDYIINRFSQEKTSYVLAVGTSSDKATIDNIGRALDIPLDEVKKIKKEYEEAPDFAKEKYKNLFYYFDGIIGTRISQSMHPAGIIASPITLFDNYGTLINKDGLTILQLDMDCVHEVGLAKYDILGLKNIGIIKKTCQYINKKYPMSHEINWLDEKVWKDILKSPIGIFQMESNFAFQTMKKFIPKTIEDMSLVTAMIRPSGASYRDNLVKRIVNKNPSSIIDELLKDNLGYLVYQEDTIKFLQDICGFSGSHADNVRRAIGRKDKDRLEKELPQILDGYCSVSNKDRKESEEEAKQFIKIIEDSASYQFNFSHSIAYSLIGYLCAYFRYYHPLEFITAFLNCSETEEDFAAGAELAELYNIKIKSPRFKYSKSDYFFDKENNIIYKGMASIKYMNEDVPEQLYKLKDIEYNYFIDLLYDIIEKTTINSRQFNILIKLNFFEEFGNIAELSNLYKVFDFFKEGDAKQFKKEKLSNNETLYNIVKRHSKETEKQFTKMDCKKILTEWEEYTKCLDIKDISFKDKILNDIEYLGYISIQTNKKEDRPKLIILESRVMISKTGKNVGQPWAVSIHAQSIGSGIKNNFTIPYNIYARNKFSDYDIINVNKCEKNQKGYWYIKKYEKIIDL